MHGNKTREKINTAAEERARRDRKDAFEQRQPPKQGELFPQPVPCPPTQPTEGECACHSN